MPSQRPVRGKGGAQAGGRASIPGGTGGSARVPPPSRKAGLWSHPVTPPSKPPRIQSLTLTVSQPIGEAFCSSTLTVPSPLTSMSTPVTTEVWPAVLVAP